MLTTLFLLVRDNAIALPVVKAIRLQCFVFYSVIWKGSPHKLWKGLIRLDIGSSNALFQSQK